MSDNKTGWLCSRSKESDLFITSMITDWIGGHKALLPINHKSYNFWKKKNSQDLQSGLLA